MNAVEKLDNRELPPIEEFYSKLKDEPCKPKYYLRAQEVWRKFDCTTFLDYHNLYLKCDVLQLADVFESFRKVCILSKVLIFYV